MIYSSLTELSNYNFINLATNWSASTKTSTTVYKNSKKQKCHLKWQKNHKNSIDNFKSRQAKKCLKFVRKVAPLFIPKLSIVAMELISLFFCLVCLFLELKKSGGEKRWRILLNVNKTRLMCEVLKGWRWTWCFHIKIKQTISTFASLVCLIFLSF